MNMPPVVGREEWQARRDELLVREKELTRELDALAAQRRRLPMVAFDGDMTDNVSSRGTTFSADNGAEGGFGVISFLRDDDGHVYQTYFTSARRRPDALRLQRARPDAVRPAGGLGAGCLRPSSAGGQGLP